MTIQRYPTTEKLFNQAVRTKVLELLPAAKGFKKLYVPNGVIYCIVNAKGQTIGNVSKEAGIMEIAVASTSDQIT